MVTISSSMEMVMWGEVSIASWSTLQPTSCVQSFSLSHMFTPPHTYTGSPGPERFPRHEVTPPISGQMFNPVQDIGEITPGGLVSLVTTPVCEQ